jgi:hypothetical protein
MGKSHESKAEFKVSNEQTIDEFVAFIKMICCKQNLNFCLAAYRFE